MKLYDLFRLSGKVALVTGGGRGIGKFIATGLAEAGADLILTSRKMKNLEATAQALSAEFGVKVLPVACDMANPEAIDAMLKTALEQFPRIDILVNNAGATWGAPTLEFPLEKWDQLFNVNVRGVWILTQKVANIMKNQGGGNIINISSVMGFRGSEETGPSGRPLQLDEGRDQPAHDEPRRQARPLQDPRQCDRPRLLPDRHDGLHREAGIQGRL